MEFGFNDSLLLIITCPLAKSNLLFEITDEDVGALVGLLVFFVRLVVTSSFVSIVLGFVVVVFFLGFLVVVALKSSLLFTVSVLLVILGVTNGTLVCVWVCGRNGESCGCIPTNPFGINSTLFSIFVDAEAR